MNQWGFYFDQSRCLGCKACTLACKNWNELRRGDNNINGLAIENYSAREGESEKASAYIDPSTGTNNYAEFRKYYMKENWRRVSTYDRGGVVLAADNTFKSSFDRRYLSISCNHCDRPACLAACPVAAIFKEETVGAVIVDSSICISCGRCRQACPWNAPQYYDENFARYDNGDPARPRMTKCILCIDRINEGLKPACVAACWNRALDAGPVEDLKTKYRDRVGGFQNPDEIDEFADSAIPESNIPSIGPNIIFTRKGRWIRRT
jgi:anaerobic dimethyl sulfoxide reductase subunit B (iron-sulfur subunit)